MKPVEYRRMYGAEERQWWYAGMRAIGLALLDDALAEDDPDGERRLLDAGCGSGLNLAHLSRRGRAWGVDVSAEALTLAAERGVATARAGVEALPFRDEVFDGVTSFDVLYHRWVRDDRAAVAEMTRVLRPGGCALVRVPALRALWGAHDEAVLSRHRYTRAELVALLEGAGLRVTRATYCNGLLLPLVFARRQLDRATGRQGSDVGFLPAPLERLFRGVLSVESRLLRHVSLPLGTSVVAVARKPGGAEGAGTIAPVRSTP